MWSRDNDMSRGLNADVDSQIYTLISYRTIKTSLSLASVAQLVEHLVAIQKVESSNLFTRFCFHAGVHMTQSQIEWYTVILPFIGIPIIVLVFVFFYWIFPAWIGSFDKEE